MSKETVVQLHTFANKISVCIKLSFCTKFKFTIYKDTILTLIKKYHEYHKNVEIIFCNESIEFDLAGNTPSTMFSLINECVKHNILSQEEVDNYRIKHTEYLLAHNLIDKSNFNRKKLLFEI